MKILKVFTKFMTNHSNSFYQIIVISIPKGQVLNDLLRGYNHSFEFINKEWIEGIEEEYKLELLSLTDGYNVYYSEERSYSGHTFYEGGQYDTGFENVDDYWDDWLQERQEIVDQLERQGIKILYLDEDSD